MNTKEIINLIENFAPLETQEGWDNCGVQIDFDDREIKKVLLALDVTEQSINQAIEKKCDMLISHHPLFFVPFSFNNNIPIYSAHTNLDKADGGTTDTIIETLDFKHSQKVGDFLRIVELNQQMSLNDLINLLKDKLELEAIRVVNNLNQQSVKKVAFCAGSGVDFAGEAQRSGAEVFITGDLKYHNALDSKIVLIDIGHFESERPVLKTIKKLLEPLNIEVIIADEKSPFINY